jgi:hypothetical protein
MSSRTLTLNTFLPRLSSSARGETAAPRSRVRGNWVSLASAAALTVLALSLGFYVYMTNAYASKGYDLKHQQGINEQLLETNKNLLIQQASLGSIGKVNDIASATGMVPVISEEFLVAPQLSSR